MEKSEIVHEGEEKDDEGQGLLAFFYGDALVKHSKGTTKRETVRLAYKEECAIIKDMLKTLGREIRFRSKPATEYNVRDCMTSGCKMLHFTGHGGCGSLEFEHETECGVVKYLKDDELADLFRNVKILPELVVLGACDSEECGQAVVKAGVPHVVAVRSSHTVCDDAAQDFSVSFYKALITGNYTVQKAFDIAVSVVQPSMSNANITFLLLPDGNHTEANHEVKMFNDLPKGDLIDETPPLPPRFNLPLARRTYIGGIELHEGLGMLKDNNTDCLTITGEPGIGKTERALQVCHYIGERDEFSAIFFAQCRDAVAYQRSIPPSGEQQAHIKRFCKLVSEALDLHPGARSPKDLWVLLRKSAEKKIGRPPFKVLLVLDAADALIEGDGGREARKSLADFVHQLCSTNSHLKLLVTSENSLQEMTGRHLENCTEQVHQVLRLDEKQLAMLLLNVYPCCKKKLSKEMNMKMDAERPEFVEALQRYCLLKWVEGNPGALCQVSPLLANRYLDHSDVKEEASRYRESKNMFSSKRANKISSQAELGNKCCRKIWLWAISRAAKVGLRRDYVHDACYRHVPWSSLSLALQQGLCQSQTAYNDWGMSFSDEYYSWSESSSRNSSGLHRFHGRAFDSGLDSQSWRCGSDSSFSSRGMDEYELNFIRGLLKRSMSEDENSLGGSECGPNDQEEWFSLEAFARFSRTWMAPFLETVSYMRKDWAMTDPVKVHGFISRQKAKSWLLGTNQAGVFMLRFSVSKPGHLILDVTCKASPNAHTGRPEGTLEVQESLVTVSDYGRWTLHYDGVSNDGNTYESLDELVIDTYRLQTLYPNKPKMTVFSTTEPTAYSR